MKEIKKPETLYNEIYNSHRHPRWLVLKVLFNIYALLYQLRNEQINNEAE